MKKLQYKIGRKETIGLIPSGAIIDVYFVCGNDDEAVIYFSKKSKWKLSDESGTENGCGCLSFACFDIDEKIWKRSPEDYINLDNKVAKKFENKIKK